MKKTRITTALGVTGLTIATLAVGLPAAANAAPAAPSVQFKRLDGVQVHQTPDRAYGSMQQELTSFQVVGRNIASDKVEVRDAGGALLCTVTLRGSSSVGTCTTAARLPSGTSDFTATPLAADGSAVGESAALRAVDERPAGPGEEITLPAPTVQDVQLKDGVLTATITTTADGVVYIHDAAGTPIDLITSTVGHPNGTTAKYTMRNVKPGQQFSATLKTPQAESGGTAFTAPAENPGEETPAPTPAPTVSNVRLVDGTLTADVTTTADGLVYGFDAKGVAIAVETGSVGHPNGTTTTLTITNATPDTQYSVALSGPGGLSEHTTFTAPADGTGPVDPPKYSASAELVSYDAATKEAVITGTQNDSGVYRVSYVRDGVVSSRIAEGDAWPDEPFTATLPGIEPGDRIHVVYVHSGQVTGVDIDVPKA